MSSAVSVSQVKGHVKDRWAQRSDDPGKSIWNAWEEAEQISGTGFYGDEVRYHMESEVFLVREEHYLTTVMEFESAKPQARRALYYFTGEKY